MNKERLEYIKGYFGYCIDLGLTIGVKEEKLLHELYDQVEQTTDLAVGYHNAQKEVLVFKNKVELLKSELQIEDNPLAIYNLRKMNQQNKRYRETIEFAIRHLKMIGGIGQVDMVINQMKDVMEDEEDLENHFMKMELHKEK